MRKGLLLLLIFVLFSPAGQTVSTRQAQNATFTTQTINVKGLPAYDMKVSPDGRIAALYVGQTATALLNIPPMEYVPVASVLPIRLIDLTTGNELGQLTGPTDYVTDVAFTPDGKQLVSSHRNGELYLWDITAKRLIKRLTSLLGGISAKLGFLPDGKTLLVKLEVGFSSNFLMWDIGTDRITKIWHKPYQSYGEIKSTSPDSMDPDYGAFDISPDGKLLATASFTGEVALWDTATLQQTVLKKAPEDHDQKTKALLSIGLITFSSQGKLLVYFDAVTNQTHIWDVASHTESKALSIGGISWGISPSGDALAWVASNHKELWFARVDQPDLATKVMDFPANLQVGRPKLTFTPDGTQIVVGGFGVADSSADNVIYLIKLK
jgi:WD40 repeat protein